MPKFHPLSDGPIDGTIVVDAMGGDRAPGEIVAGALLAHEEQGIPILLVGRRDAIEHALPKPLPAGVSIEDTPDVIEMDEEPATAVRRKPDSSIVRGAELVRAGRGAAFVSAGNTGAVLASAIFRIGRLAGIARPAIATPIPVLGHTPTFLIDSGAAVDCPPEWLVQFAQMGRALAQIRLGIETPRIGLLSNGEEPGKGDELRKTVYPLLEAAVPGFIGNVEGRDLVNGGCDVAVTDGFTGNVVLKAVEGAFRVAATVVARAVEQIDLSPTARQDLMKALLTEASQLDVDNTGGALLAGVDGVCVISHGSSSARAIATAVRLASDYVAADIVGRMRTAIAGRPPEA